MPVALSSQEVAHVARLARLRLSAEELERMRSQLSNILDYIAMLQEVNVDGVPPTAQVTDLVTVMRPDEVTTGLTREQALANAPDQREGMFRVKPVFDA
jgi:aspartyl-tRNA(Asn)/glutamyl-tRNA(Gln) amidotransferase subunit C